MPLILGDHVINYINGPSAMTILKPKRSGNTFILFGERHNIQYYHECEYENCVELQTTFIEKLNDFAKDHSVDFFIEEFFRYGDHTIMDLESIDESKKASARQFGWLGTKSMREYKANPIGKKVKGMQESNMTQMTILYRPCFFQKIKSLYNCPYKNIRWQYADARDACQYKRGCGMKDNHLVDVSYYGHDSLRDVLGYFLKSENHEDDLYNAFETFDKVMFGYDKILLLLQNKRQFVIELLESPLFKKQYDRTDKSFTVDSFVQLIDYYFRSRKMQTPSKLEKIIILIEKIRDLGILINTERSLNTKTEEYKIVKVL